MKQTMLEAGTTVLVFGALFAGTLLLAVLVTIAAAEMGITALGTIADKSIGWAEAAFFALMGVLGHATATRKAPPSPPVTHYPPDDTTGGRA